MGTASSTSRSCSTRCAVRHPALQPQREAKLRAMLTREKNRAKTATPAARIERVQPSTLIGHVNEPDGPRPERRDPLREMRARRLASRARSRRLRRERA